VASFDLYRHGNGYMIDLQANLLDHGATRVAAPMIPAQDVAQDQVISRTLDVLFYGI